MKAEELEVAHFNPSIKKYIFVVGLILLCITIIGIPLALIWGVGVGQTLSKKYYQNLYCTLTTKQLQFGKGMFFKVEKTIPLENIQDLTFIQNPILNYFGLKILKIETAGNSGAGGADMKLIGVEKPEEFKVKVLSQREKLKDRAFSASPTINSDAQQTEILLEIRDLLKKIEARK